MTGGCYRAGAVLLSSSSEIESGFLALETPPPCRVRPELHVTASQGNQRMASAKKRIVECSACRRIMKVCTDVETTSDADHLYVMSASNALLPGLVKIGRSKNPLQRAIDLQEI